MCNSVAILAQAPVDLFTLHSYRSLLYSYITMLEHIVEELKQSHKFKDRPVMAAIANSIVAKIGNMPGLDTAGALVLTSQVEMCEFDAETAKRFNDAIDAKLTATLVSATVAAVDDRTQYLLEPTKYATQSLYDGLCNKKADIQTKMHMTAEFMNKCGCSHPHEQTYKIWLAMVIRLHFEDTWPTYRAIFGFLQDLKHNVEHARRPFPFPRIIRYPKMPSDLSPPIFKHIYGDDNPIDIEIDRLHQTAQHIPLRKNNKLLTNEAKGIAGGSTPVWSDLCDNPALPSWLRTLAQAASSQPHITLTPHAQKKRAQPSREDDDDDQPDSPTTAKRQRLLASLKPKSHLALRMCEPASPVPTAQYARPGPSMSPNLLMLENGPPLHRSPSSQDSASAYVGAHQSQSSQGSACAYVGASALVLPSDDDVNVAPNGSVTLVGKQSICNALPASVDACSTELAVKDQNDVLSIERSFMTALRCRDEKRKEEKEAKKQQSDIMKRPAAAPPPAIVDGAPPVVIKRPANAAPPVVIKRPAACAPPIIGDPVCPSIESHKPVDYNGARIYTSYTKRQFRIIVIAGSYGTEKVMRWHCDNPTADAWTASLRLVDARRASEAAGEA